MVLRKLFYKFTWTSVLNNDLENSLAKYRPNIVLANRVAYISRPFNLQLLFVCIFYCMLSHWNDVIVAGVSLLCVFFFFFPFIFRSIYYFVLPLWLLTWVNF